MDSNPYNPQNPYSAPSQGAPAQPSGFFALTTPLDQPAYGCGMGEAFIRFWKKYATFKGRASRGEFWWWIVWLLIITVAFGLIPNAFGIFGTGARRTMQDFADIIEHIFNIASFIPMLALSVRRLHDINKPGWLLAIYCGFEIIGSILAIAGAFLLGALEAVVNGGTPMKYVGHAGVSEEAAFLGLGLFFIGIVIMLIMEIIYIVFMASKSNPAGARYDASYMVPAGYAPMPPAAGYYDPGAPQQKAYGAPYAAPMTQQNPYAQNYANSGYAPAATQQTVSVAPPVPASTMPSTAPIDSTSVPSEPQRPAVEQTSSENDENRGNASNQQI
jgi:uncharacterized membrane protein YhaH (DUF805 family)